MRVLVLKEPGAGTGGTPVLAIEDAPVPVPAAGEALVRVAACGFCRHDYAVMAGLLRRGVKPGVILGHEISGVVEEVGPAVSEVRVGDRVVSLLTNACGECDRCLSGREHRCRTGEGIGHGRDGGFAQFAAISQHSLAVIPESIDLTEACLLACPIGVALAAVQETAQAAPGHTVLVTGAGGGLGVHAVQAAVALGARVLALTSSPEKSDRLRQLGAGEVLETPDLDFSELVLALTADEGADVVIDTVGSALFPSTLRSLAQFGRLVLLGEVTGGRAQVSPAEIIFRDAQILGASGVSRAGVAHAMRMASDGALRPVVDRVLGLEDAAEAFRLMSEGTPFGRVVLTPPD